MCTQRVRDPLHTYIRTHTHTHTHTAHTHTHTCTGVRLPPTVRVHGAGVCTHTHTHTSPTHAHTHTHTSHARTHTHTHTHITHVYTHTDSTLLCRAQGQRDTHEKQYLHRKLLFTVGILEIRHTRAGLRAQGLGIGHLDKLVQGQGSWSTKRHTHGKNYSHRKLLFTHRDHGRHKLTHTSTHMITSLPCK